LRSCIVLESRECLWLRLASRPGARVWLQLVLFTVFLPGPGSRPPRGYRPRGHALAMADLLVVAGIVVFVVAMLALIRGLERI
jgi:hypothetical protein